MYGFDCPLFELLVKFGRLVSQLSEILKKSKQIVEISGIKFSNENKLNRSGTIEILIT